MNRKSRLALSPMGIAIAIIILLALVMIISTPMIVDSSSKKAENKNNEINTTATQPPITVPTQPTPEQQTADQQTAQYQQLQNQLHYLELRISNLESYSQKNNTSSSQPTTTNQYNCTIEGVVDENGNTVPFSKARPATADTKYVFVCGRK